jgi:hypothetical protein
VKEKKVKINITVVKDKNTGNKGTKQKGKM